jgi:hypothetical protein
LDVEMPVREHVNLQPEHTVEAVPLLRRKLVQDLGQRVGEVIK